MKEIFLLMKTVRKRYAAYLALTVLGVFASAAIPLLNMRLVDGILIEGRLEQLQLAIVAYLILAVLNVALYMLVPLLKTQIHEEIAFQLKVELSEAIQYKTENKDSSSKIGDAFNVYTHDIDAMSQLLSETMKGFLEHSLNLLVTFIVLFAFDARIGFLALAMVPAYLGIPYFVRNKVLHSTRRVREKQSEINGWLQEFLKGKIQLKLLGQEEWMQNKLTKTFRSLIPLRLREVLYQNLSSGTLVIYWVGLLLVLWIGGTRVVAGVLSIGGLLAIVNYLDRLEWPVSRLATLMTDYNRAKVSRLRFSNYSAAVSEKTEKELVETVTSIEFSHVSFGFSEGESEILKGLHATFERGQQVAIVGESGAGKSTFLNVFFGFAIPTKGEIKINGIAMPASSIRNKIAYFSQDNYLFNISFYENIALGAQGKVEKEDVIRAAKLSGAHAYIEKFPRKYDTIYEGNLSAGQQQRLLLSRLFLRNPDILLLDEPTSNLDDQTAQFVMKQLLEFAKDKILMVVSHDVSTLKTFDRVLMLKDGELLNSLDNN